MGEVWGFASVLLAKLLTSKFPSGLNVTLKSAKAHWFDDFLQVYTINPAVVFVSFPFLVPGSKTYNPQLPHLSPRSPDRLREFLPMLSVSRLE